MDCPRCGTLCSCSVPSALTTSPTVETPVVSHLSVDARAGMNPDEPIEPRFTADTGKQTIEDAVWRAELAFRVCSYRARRRRRIDEQNSPGLDFGPASEAQSFGEGTGVAPQAQAPPHARNTIDTNYYRRLNAESMAQDAGMRMDVTVAATARARVFDAELPAENDDLLREALPDTQADEPSGNSVLDLEIRPTAAADSVLERYCIAAAEAEPEPQLPASPVPGNLIVFRRPLLEPPLLPQPCRDELAEPINHRPRILEVPEDIIPAVQGSLFPEIRLDVDEPEGASEREPEIEVPLQVAPLSERLIAAMTDLGVVIAASLLFSVITWRALPGIPHTKPFWMALAAVTALLWVIYQYLFVLFAGRTFGMSIRGIRLSTFDGRTPQWEQRSRRAQFMFISFAAATLGFLWALVDEDALCWHDRISHTFPTSG